MKGLNKSASYEDLTTPPTCRGHAVATAECQLLILEIKCAVAHLHKLDLHHSIQIFGM